MANVEDGALGRMSDAKGSEPGKSRVCTGSRKKPIGLEQRELEAH